MARDGFGGWIRGILGATVLAAFSALPAVAQVPSWPTPAETPAPKPPSVATPAPEPQPPGDPDAPAQPVDDAGDATGEEIPAEGSKAETARKDLEEEEGLAHTGHAPFDVAEIESEPFTFKWSNFVSAVRGLSRYSLFDGQMKFRVGGKMQIDGTAGGQTSDYLEFYPEISNSLNFRRLRLYAVGIVRDLNFNVSFDAGADAGFKNIWVEGRDGGLTVWGHFLGKLRLGQMMEPFSLERQTSSNFGGFLERSLPVQTFSPGHNIGAMVHSSNAKGRVTWAAGLFSWGQQNESNASGSLLSLTGRMTGLLLYREEGRDLVHVGISVSTRSPVGATRYRSRPEARFASFLVDTENIDAANLTLVGLEVATVKGPIWAQAEYIWSKLDAQLVGDPLFDGFYAQVGWFLTGNVKPYRRNSGVFDRVQPEENFRKGNPFSRKGGGALELVGRISAVDLTDGEVEGGRLTDFSAAFNWYLNATTRVQLNYVRAVPEDRGAANIFLLRFQYNPW